MYPCVRPNCAQSALASWWQLCAECSQPLLNLNDGPTTPVADQRLAAGWDALGWAERIAPDHWGSATDDGWVTTVRSLALASVVTGRSSGCAHTASSTSAALT